MIIDENNRPKVKEIDGLMSRKARKQLARNTGTKFTGISQYRGAADEGWEGLR